MPKIFTTLLAKVRPAYQSTITRLRARPMLSFFIVLGILLVAILISKFAFTPKETVTPKTLNAKTVPIYHVSSVPKLTFQGQIKKIGVIQIVAQTPAVVQQINVKEGDEVKKGTNLVTLSSNYQGANAAAIQSQIANRQYQQITDTFSDQQDLINKQIDLTNTMHDNSSNLATISAQSKNDTQNLINLNQDILNSLNTNLTNLKNSNVGGSNDAAILQVEQGISQLQGGQNQLQSALRNLNYSTDTNNAPQHLLDLQRDITVKQLNLQEKGLEMNRDISKLQLTLANIAASLFHPAAPISGKIVRIFIHPLDLVNPGNPLLTIVGDNKTTQLTLTIPAEAANRLSQIEPATIHFKNSQQDLYPTFVSTEPTDQNLYSVVFNLPEADYDQAANNDYVSVDLPVGNSQHFGSYFLPIDSVIQTQDQALVYVLQNGKAVAKKLTLADVSGQFVEVTSGLSGNEQIILDRNIVEGDQVKPQ